MIQLNKEEYCVYKLYFVEKQHMLLRSKERKKNAANVKINYRNIAAEKSYTQLQQGNTKAQNDQVLFHFL